MKIKVNFNKGEIEGVNCEIFASPVWSFKLTDKGESKIVAITTDIRAKQRLEKALNNGLTKVQKLEIVEKQTITDLG